MIVFYNVCEHCGKQTQITEDKTDEWNKGCEFYFSIVGLSESIKGSKFPGKLTSFTFCDKECVLEYLKVNFEKSRGNK